MEKSGGVDVNLLSTKVCAAAPFSLKRLSYPGMSLHLQFVSWKHRSKSGAGVKVQDTGGKQHAGTEYMCQNWRLKSPILLHVSLSLTGMEG